MGVGVTMKTKFRAVLSALFNILDREGFIIAIGGFLYGRQLFKNPNILENYKVYDIIDELANNRDIGLIFMIVGIVQFIGVVFDYKILRRLGFVLMSSLFAMFMVSFFMSPPPNTVWVLTGIIFFSLIRASAREETK